MNLQKKWTVYLIHHSHTDIGYTERQDKIIRYHCYFIKQAVDILNDIHAGRREGCQGFVWQCENYWQVKNFYDHASPAYIADFEKYVKSGEIGLSGNYLNMTELVSYDVLSSRIAQAKAYGNQLGVAVKSGMSADINGYAWSYGDALCENGVENLYSCIHAHHGLFPLRKKQTPFWWETPKGNRVLVWNGEYYHFGNELCFAPHGASTYMIQDEISRRFASSSIYRESAEDTDSTELASLHSRLERYLQNLESEGYPADFIPIMVSGAITDNAFPSAEIARRVNLLNEKYEGQVEFHMTTLDAFFDRVRATFTDIPTYRGDWNDWWADGVGSTPAAVKHFRGAQRKYDLCRKLDPNTALGDEELMEQAAENMMLYAEHTWGYSSSVSEPWETLVNDLDLKKTAYAVNANTEVSLNLDQILAAKGETTIKQGRPQRYKVINPHPFPVRMGALLYVEFWEYIDGVMFDLNTPFEVVDEATGQVLPSQIKRIARAYQIEALVELQAGEERELMLRYTGKKANATVQNHAYVGAEGVRDIVVPGQRQQNTSYIETDCLVVRFDQETGLCSVIDKRTGDELLRDGHKHAPFTGIYEVTDADPSMCAVRTKMGRNRKSPATKRYESRLTGIEIVENGDVYVAVRMDYALEGTKFYSVFLKIYQALPRMEAMVRIHKTSVWEPENLYIALPFTAGQGDSQTIDKTGCAVRPGIDQLPGTNQEFYLLQNGLVCQGENKTVRVAVKDTPLMVFGSLKAHPIELCDGDNTALNQSCAYSWVMNNFWETNFKVDLGGFYEFAYTVSVEPRQADEEALARCQADNEGVISFYR